MKFCVDCKHYQFNEYGRWMYEQHKCMYKPENESSYTDLVTGELVYPLPRYESSYIKRMPGETCGPEGLLWELKD